MRKLFAVLALAALLVTPAFADQTDGDNVPATDVSVAVDTSPFVLIWYVGTAVTGATTVQIADDTWTLIADGAADTSIECPLSGAYGGLLDVTNAACDTVAELMDVVNNTAGSNWRIAPINAFGDDDPDEDALAAAAAEARGDGVVVYYDDSVAFDHRASLFPGYFDSGDIKPEFFAPNRRDLLKNPFAGQRSVLKYAHYNITSSGTMTDLTVSCVITSITPNAVSFDTNVIYLEADPTTGVTGLINEFNYAGGGLVCEDGRITVGLPTDTDLTAPQVVISGFVEDK